MQKLQISIPEPCHENWYAMTPTQQGRFCNACTKEVIDFSMMTDTEVLNYFTSITHEKVCGRALPSQLDRTITWPKEPKKKLFWYWNYIVMFFMFFSKANIVKAQGNVRVVTASELSRASVSNVYDALACKVGEPVKISSWLISGKVTDIDGNPVSFATIKIKGLPTGLSADANGTYSIKANLNDVLLISGAGYKGVQAPVGTQKVINIVLERGTDSDLKEMAISRTYCIKRSSRIKAIDPINTKHAINFQVKDDITGLLLENTKIIVAQKSVNQFDTAFTDKNGMYVLADIISKEEYYIKVEAEGYEANEFSFMSKDINNKKKIWEVLLKKIETIKPDERPIRLGGICTVSVAKGPIYVVDGTIVPKGNEINPDDIDNITVLLGSDATAIYGSNAANGTIVITTRKAKTKILDTVVVSSGYLNKGLVVRAGGVNVRTKVTKYADIKARVLTRLTDSLKIYPNPVQKGTALSVSLKLKQAGTYIIIQVTNAAGRIVLQKQTNILSKEHIEQLQTDNRWGSGVYYIRVFSINNKLINKASFIVQ